VATFSSLADALGIPDPKEPNRPARPAAQKMSRKDLCKQILASQEYRESLLRRIVLDALPPAVECMLWDRAEGKVAAKVEVKDTTNALEGMTVEQLESRALFLAEVARRLRSDGDVVGASEAESEEERVH
jgi:hypothetical protein